MKKIAPVIFCMFIFCNYQNEKKSLTVYVKLPKKIKELSGMSLAKSSSLLWTIEDSGNKNCIYGLDSKGVISKEIIVSNAQNIDWEELTTDDEGALYIGDFGNNQNIRKDLTIYKIDNSSLNNSQVASSQKTTFYYPEQLSFPPVKKKMFYDCEAFFEMNGFFYLFTKNRSKHFDGTVLLYKVPNQSGHFPAQYLGEYKTCSDDQRCAITGAALSHDKKKVVLLSHDSVWLFEGFKDDIFFNGTLKRLDLDHYSQKEAVCFLTNNTLLVGDERQHRGGNIYLFTLSQLKAKP